MCVYIVLCVCDGGKCFIMQSHSSCGKMDS